jgi:hypothetical protein
MRSWMPACRRCWGKEGRAACLPNRGKKMLSQSGGIPAYIRLSGPRRLA